MIARPHICLRCQSRLARPSASSKIRVAFQSTDSRPHRSAILPDDLEDDEGPHALIKRPLKLSRRPLGSAKPLSEFPLGKLYGYTGQQLRENREKLPINILGETMEVIVLRDSKISKHRQPYEEDVETKEGFDILARLDEERGLVGWEEVQANINEFRPRKGRNSQTREQFGGLLTGLQSGFTVAQLARYLKTHGQKNVSSPQPITASHALRISPWSPGISESDQRLDNDHLRGYDLQSYTPKQRLVLRILRECWKLELSNVEEGIGQLEVELKPGDLDLLLRGSISALNSILSSYILDREERLETFRSNDAKRSRNAIRITGTRAKCFLVVQEIEDALRGIYRTQLPLKALMPPSEEREQNEVRKWVDTHFGDSVVEELARLTNTDIRKTSGGSLFIASVDHDSDTSRSSRTDSALRLVVTSGNFSDRETSWVGCKETRNAADGVLVNYPMTGGLAWRDRLRQWTRWVTPIAKEATAKDTTDSASQQNEDTAQLLSPTPKDSEILDESDLASQLHQSDTSNNELLDTASQETDSPSISDIGGWSTHLGIQSSALIGTVLYNQPETPSYGDPRTNSLFANAIRSFSTSVPNISRILTTSVASRRAPTEGLVLRFTPNPFARSPTSKIPLSSAALRAFPPIEMRFNINRETKALNLNFIRAIISTENSDLMLPDAPTDIRFQQRTSSRLYTGRKHLPEGILDFLKKSNLTVDYSKGGLTTPPSMKVPIASFLCDQPNFEVLGAAKKDAEVQEVEYLFAGLEIRKTIPMEFEGWRLLYTSVEAGKAGGRRGELRLRPERTIESDDPELETEEAFLATAYRLADSSYTPLEVRRVMVENVRMVTTYKEKKTDRTFRYFAKRPKITFWRERSSKEGDETGEEILDDDENVDDEVGKRMNGMMTISQQYDTSDCTI